jgi:hypothetical protein
MEGAALIYAGTAPEPILESSMDIHAPEGPTRSFKDFAIHILIVTVGILIALGLDGIRATVHEHNLLVETRATFRTELELDRKRLVDETANVNDKSAALESTLRDYQKLVKNPDELRKQVDHLQPGFYYFRGTAWGAASSSGVLAYMKPDEANRYADLYFEIGAYQTTSRQGVLDFTAVKSFFDSRHSFTPQDAVEGEQRLRAFQFDLKAMKFADPGFMDDLNAALGSQ